MSHILDHPNKDKIIQAIIDKGKWEWIKAEYKCGLGTISKFRKELGLTPPKPKTTDEDRKKILELRKEKKLTELSEMFGVSDSYISKLCVNSNLYIRNHDYSKIIRHT